MSKVSDDQLRVIADLREALDGRLAGDMATELLLARRVIETVNALAWDVGDPDIARILDALRNYRAELAADLLERDGARAAAAAAENELDAARAALAVLEASEACPCCLRRYEQHEDWCALWAVQRAIEGESARRASEGP